MNKEIDWIHHVTTFAILTDGEWTLSSFPPNPDEIVVRSINYTTTGVDAELLLISTDQLRIIGSLITVSNFSSSPGTRIQVRNPLSQLTFTLLTPTAPPQGASGLVTITGDTIAISLDFIKYRK